MIQVKQSEPFRCSPVMAYNSLPLQTLAQAKSRETKELCDLKPCAINPHKSQSSFLSGVCTPAALKARCSHVQPHGTTPCFCRPPDDVCGDEGCQEVPSTELVAVSTGYHGPVSVLGSGRVDPFGCFPVEMSPYMNFLVDYCK